MSRFILCISVLALIAGGCDDDNYNNNQTYRQGPTENKPVVSIVPIIDNTKNDYEWNLSDELSSAIYNRIAKRDHLQLNNVSRVREKIRKLDEKHNPFGTDISWVKNAFQDDDFVVFLELVKHEEVPQQNRKNPCDPHKCNAELQMSMRVRIFDLRKEEPKVILQELAHDNHFVPRPFTQENFYQVPWGDESFSISTLGLAHAEFTKALSARIEDYILIR